MSWQSVGHRLFRQGWKPCHSAMVSSQVYLDRAQHSCLVYRSLYHEHGFWK